jgi:hypothetical protein
LLCQQKIRECDGDCCARLPYLLLAQQSSSYSLICCWHNNHHHTPLSAAGTTITITLPYRLTI